MDRKVFVTLYKFLVSPTMIILLIMFYLASLSTIFGEQDAMIPTTDVRTQEQTETTTTIAQEYTETTTATQEPTETTTSAEATTTTLQHVEIPTSTAQEHAEITTINYNQEFSAGRSRIHRRLKDNISNQIVPHKNNSVQQKNKTLNGEALFFEVIKIPKRQNNSSNKLKEEILNEEASLSTGNQSLLAGNLSEITTEILETTTVEDVTKMPEVMGSAAPLVAKNTPGKKKLILGDPLKLPEHGCPKFCQAGQRADAIGSCMTVEECHKREGTAAGSCCGAFLVCCQIAQYCGDTSSERLVSFQSAGYPKAIRGSLACDFDLLVQQDVCAVRVEFVQAKFFSKIGGVCDVDQVLILNSVDGPTSSQCGDLTGYSTTVAVNPGQEKPLKIVVITQNEGFYSWNIRLRQIQCTELSHFKRPPVCGSKIAHDPTVSFYQLLDLWRNTAWHTSSQYSDEVWWRDSAPAYNRFYYGTTRKALSKGPQMHDLAEDRIIGGNEAELYEFPWQVAIILKRVFFCGGSLINDEYVLSAAHCFLTQDTPVEDLVVFLGDHDLTTSNDTINDIRGVKQVHYHAHFHALLLSNDIAMLQLDRPVAFSQRIRPICLPESSIAVLGLTGTVAGWGITTYPDGKPNAILQKLDVQIMSNEFCENALSEDLGPGNLCAVPRGHQGTCFGDSGGPLTIHRHGKETLIGIVSFGIAGCAVTPGLPDLYTRVSEYLQWVDISAIKYLE